MNRMKKITMAVMLALLVGPLMAWLATAAYAQTIGVLTGIVYDDQGKPYPDVTLTITNVDANKTVDVKTDAKGNYSMGGVTAAVYNIDVKMKDQLLCQTGIKVPPGLSPKYDINLKELNAAKKC